MDAVEPRLCLPSRASVTPQTLPTLSQEAMRAKAAPEIRAKQGSSKLPPACRGSDCSVEEFLQSMKGRFEVVHRPKGWQDGQRMRGKHVVILLPGKEEHALSQANQLLDHHGDFSRKSGLVQMTETARLWLGNRRGAVQAREKAPGHSYEKLQAFLKGTEAKINTLVRRMSLGKERIFDALTDAEIDAQFQQWRAKAGSDMATAGELHELEKELKLMRGMLVQASLVSTIVPQQAPAGLCITVVAGAQTAQFTGTAFPFDGLVLAPVAAQQAEPAREAAAGPTGATIKQALRGTAGAALALTDLHGKPVADDAPLSGKLVLAAVDGDDPNQILSTTNNLARVICDASSERGPVVLYSFMGAVAARAEGCERQHVKDGLWEQVLELGARAESLQTQLLEFVQRNSPGEPIKPDTAEKWSDPTFVQKLAARIRAVKDPSIRRGGEKLLAEYRELQARTQDLGATRQRNLLQTIAARFVAGPGRDGSSGMGMLAAYPELVQTWRDVIQGSVELGKQLGDKVVIAKVSVLPQ